MILPRFSKSMMSLVVLVTMHYPLQGQVALGDIKIELSPSPNFVDGADSAHSAHFFRVSITNLKDETLSVVFPGLNYVVKWCPKQSANTCDVAEVDASRKPRDRGFSGPTFTLPPHATQTFQDSLAHATDVKAAGIYRVTVRYGHSAEGWAAVSNDLTMTVTR